MPDLLHNIPLGSPLGSQGSPWDPLGRWEVGLYFFWKPKVAGGQAAGAFFPMFFWGHFFYLVYIVLYIMMDDA